MARIDRPLMISMVLVLAAPLGAQVPEPFTNLQVLPEDVGRRELVDTMRGYAGALGVRCNYCHLGENPDNLDGYDFASDDKETKRVARAMMRMTREINDNLLPKTGRENLLTVSCLTCHHGVEKPQDLREILAAELATGGVAAVGARYRELHEKYHGRSAYDFSEFTLTSLAERVARGQDDPATALALLDLNAELHPEAAYTYVMKARVFLMTDARDSALRSFERALELDPENDWVRRQIERLKEPPADE